MNHYFGSCLCGAVAFKINAAVTGFFLCHCSRCRKKTGSAHAANLFSSGGELIWLRGEDKVRTFRLPETRCVKSFCMDCGCAMPIAGDGRLVIPAGSLDCDVDAIPTAHIFFGSRANWDQALHEVARFESLPPKI